MKHTMRWYGPKDGVSLMDIRQAGCTGVVTALHQIPVGEVWSQEAIQERIDIIQEDNEKYTPLTWDVVESLPVHESIKKGIPEREEFIANYKQSLANLASCGVKTVCYNFMPVLDWSRTQLDYSMEDGSYALRFVYVDFAAFDLFILKRAGAESDYTQTVQEKAKARFEAMSEEERKELQTAILQGLPGSDDAFELGTFQGLLDEYRHIGDKELRENLYYFIKQVGPVAKELGVRLCIHPDDPPRPLIGLPRVLSTGKDIAQLMEAYDDPANGLTFCTGSLGVRADNDLPSIVKQYGNRIHFLHLRTTLRETEDWVFHEAPHMAGDVDFYDVIEAILLEEKRRTEAGEEVCAIPMRPDHGHHFWSDSGKKYYPGYSYMGRLKGLAELRGMEIAIGRQLK
ncbi:mannonate dehydratase [Marinilongibacter aquaticus]|uniref:mannonate dehydratase n=1 Tax=Marinilongibacter aquaticus TaxID=2975157 RepID=UPI0021BD8089|nr:mannonate dehydratase [Marinilongibacter aquaticus]UBM57736.1 mannonate dehydratase [Marinilongibacter aquaticus]